MELYKKRQESEQRVDPEEVEETVRIMSIDQSNMYNTQRKSPSFYPGQTDDSKKKQKQQPL